MHLLLGLFSRNRGKRAEALLAAIRREPGLSYSVLRERLQLGGGNFDHHLHKLQQSGRVIVHRYANTVRYFENHELYRTNWQAHAALRDPDLKRLQEWVLRHADVNQLSVLDTTKNWGWSRSKAQRALQELVDAKILDARREGRYLLYTARPLPGDRLLLRTPILRLRTGWASV